jgi:hypothetical protein
VPDKKRNEATKQRKSIDEALRNAPSCLQELLKLPSQIASSIVGGAPKPSDKFINYTDDEHQQMIQPATRGPAGGKGRAAVADNECREIRARHLKHWGLRHMAKTIAAQEGKHQRTIERYFLRCPR